MQVTQDTNNEMKSTSDYVEDPKENLINGDIEKESSKGDIEENPLSKDAETLCTNEEEDPVDEKSSSCSESRPVISEVTQTWQGKEWNLWKTVTNIHPPHDTQYVTITDRPWLKIFFHKCFMFRVPDGPTNIDEECGNIEQNTKAPQRLRLFSKNLFDTIQQKVVLSCIPSDSIFLLASIEENQTSSPLPLWSRHKRVRCQLQRQVLRKLSVV